MWMEGISILQYISIATFNGISISNLLLPLFIGLFKWCTFWRWDQRFFIPFTVLLIILIYSGTFGVQHVYFCIDNVVIFNRFITDIPGTCIFIMGNPEFIWWIILVWIWLIQRFVMEYWIVIQDHMLYQCIDILGWTILTCAFFRDV